MGRSKKQHLRNVFDMAIRNHKWVAIKVSMEGFPEEEIIVNPPENAASKLAYYEKTYDENLEHKFAKGIKIIDCTWSNSFGELETFTFMDC